MAKFIYGGTTGETPETIARKREMAMALVANQGTPRDIGEGLNAIGDALLARRMYKGAGRAEEAGRAGAPKFGFDPVMSALTRQSPAASGGNSVMAALDPKAPASIEERMGGRPFDAVREALIKQESGGNPNAISPKGAVGVTQVMPATAMDPGFGVPSVFDIAQAKGIQVASRDKATAIELLKNPQINEELGGKYFDAMANRYGGDLQQAAAAYNGGPGRLDSVGGNIGRMPAETQAYVPAVTGGQPQQVAQAGGGMFDPEVYNQAMAVLQHPFADPQSKAAAQAYVEQAQKDAAKRSDPAYNLDIQKTQLEIAKLRSEATGIPLEQALKETEIEKNRAAIEKQRREIETDERKKQGRDAQEVNQASLAIDEIDRAIGIMDNDGLIGSTGSAAMLSGIAGTDARKLDAVLSPVRAGIGFAELQRMRDNSPTGGALGGITENELKFLQSVKGSLDPAMGEEMLKDNLNRLWNTYQDIIHGPNGGPQRRQLSYQNKPAAGQWTIEEIQEGGAL
jgi:hypothetical protein